MSRRDRLPGWVCGAALGYLALMTAPTVVALVRLVETRHALRAERRVRCGLELAELRRTDPAAVAETTDVGGAGPDAPCDVLAAARAARPEVATR